jgi:hypothetical protein
MVNQLLIRAGGYGNFLVYYELSLVLLDYSEKLMNRYNAFTFVKWIYLFGFLMVIPFGIGIQRSNLGGVH